MYVCLCVCVCVGVHTTLFTAPQWRLHGSLARHCVPFSRAFTNCFSPDNGGVGRAVDPTDTHPYALSHVAH